MHSPTKSFNSTTPSKVFNQATIHSTTFRKKIQLPTNMIKVSHLNDLAINLKQNVKATIQKNEQQNNLFRRLEIQDIKKRDELLNKIENRIQQINTLKKNGLKKISEDFHKINRKVMKKHQQFLHKQEQYAKSCEKRSTQITTELLQFYKNQKVKEEKQWVRLRKLKTCFFPAKMMIQRRESLKQQFSLQTQKEILQDYNKNGPKINPQLSIQNSRRAKRLKKAYENFHKNLSENHHKFIQTYGHDIDEANNMQTRKISYFNKTRSRIHDTIKDRRQKWSVRKAEVDDQSSIISPRCIQKMNQTLNASFKMTMTSSEFYSTNKTWMSKNAIQKDELKRIQRERDDRILEKHIDTTRMNKGEDSLNSTFLDLKMKASFNARQFL